MAGSDGRAGVAKADIETRVARLAARQHGVVTRGQLLDAGLTPDMIRWRLRAGGLVRVHRGVYRLGALVGPLRPARHLEMAAVLACGSGAAASHGSALYLRGLVPDRPRGPVHLVMRRSRCRRPGIVAHRTASLPDADVGVVDGIPTTRAIRTILDVAPDLTPRQLERVTARAERSQLLDFEALRERVRVEDGRPGIRGLRALLNSTDPTVFTRSQAEDRFLQLLRKAGIPEPEVNVRIGRRELDFLWRDLRVAVEVDGFAFHASRRSFEGDRARDFDLGAEGIEVRRVTWRQIDLEPLAVVRRLAATLTRAEVRRF